MSSSSERRGRPFNPSKFADKVQPDRDVEGHLNGFENERLARRLNRNAATAIDNITEHGDGAARMLRACAGEGASPCLLLVCFLCMRTYRRWFTDQAIRLAEEFQDRTGHRGTIVTVIPAGLKVSAGHLHEISVPALRLKIWKWIESLELRLPVIAGIDVSFNFVKNSDEPGHWQVHFATFVLGHGNDKEAHDRLKDRIKAVIPLEPTAPKPLKTVPLRDPMRQLSYLQKSQFFYRIRQRKSGRWNTVKHPPPLAGAHLAEAVLWQQDLPLTGRLVLNGLERRGSLIVETDLHKPTTTGE